MRLGVIRGTCAPALRLSYLSNDYAEQTYDPTIEDAYRKQLVVDNRMCFVEVIDTAGQGVSSSILLWGS